MISRVVNAPSFAEQLGPVVAHTFASADFTPNQYGRRFAGHVPVDAVTTAKAFALFGLTKAADEPMYGNFVGHNFADGAFVHPHTDPAPVGFHHVRCNIVIKLPDNGGMPILGGAEVPVKVGDVWVCFASLEEHASTPVLGGERIVLSLGALARRDAAEAVFKELTM
jgi:hypothetical protein